MFCLKPKRLLRGVFCAVCGKPHSVGRSLLRSSLLGATYNIGPCACCGSTCVSEVDFTGTPQADPDCRTVDFGVSPLPPEGCDCTYSWNFGDGETGSGATPTHEYDCDSSQTEFDVTLTATCNDSSSRMIEKTVEVCPCESTCTSVYPATGSTPGCSGSTHAPPFAIFSLGYGSEETVYTVPESNSCVSQGDGCDIGGVAAGTYVCRLSEGVFCRCWLLEGSFGSCSLQTTIDGQTLPCFLGRTFEIVGAQVCLGIPDATYFYAQAGLSAATTSSGTPGCITSAGVAFGAVFRAPHGGDLSCHRLRDVTWECTGMTGSGLTCTEGTYNAFDYSLVTTVTTTCADCRVRHWFDVAGAIAGCSLAFA